MVPAKFVLRLDILPTLLQFRSDFSHLRNTTFGTAKLSSEVRMLLESLIEVPEQVGFDGLKRSLMRVLLVHGEIL